MTYGVSENMNFGWRNTSMFLEWMMLICGSIPIPEGSEASGAKWTWIIVLKIDLVVLGSTVKSRREAVLCYLAERGHYAQEVKNGPETLLLIDNSYYRIFPMTKAYYKIPVQGVNLVPAYV